MPGLPVDPASLREHVEHHVGVTGSSAALERARASVEVARAGTRPDWSWSLMYGRRVPKNHPRVEACGAVDELNAALGLARATATDDFVARNLPVIQKDLIVLMGELGVLPEDLPRYIKDGYSPVTPAMTAPPRPPS